MNTVAKYINPDEALMRMTGFVQQPDFQMLTQTKQEDIAAFLVEMEQKDISQVHAAAPSSRSIWFCRAILTLKKGSYR